MYRPVVCLFYLFISSWVYSNHANFVIVGTAVSAGLVGKNEAFVPVTGFVGFNCHVRTINDDAIDNHRRGTANIIPATGLIARYARAA